MNPKKIIIRCENCHKNVEYFEEVAPGLYTFPELTPYDSLKLEELRKKLYAAIKDYGQTMRAVEASSQRYEAVSGQLRQLEKEKFNAILKVLGPWAKEPRKRKK